jgi:hypothetical protein
MDDHGAVPGSRDVRLVLRSDPIARLLGERIGTPAVLGTVLALLVIGMIVFGPSTDSRFIYTDF